MNSFAQETLALTLVIVVALIALKRALTAGRNSTKAGCSGCQVGGCEAKKPATTIIVPIPSPRR